MRPQIIPKDKEHLKTLIAEEIRSQGQNCDLNHIDVSQIKDMNGLFCGFKFNGDISDWNVSNVENMSYMFANSNFNGNISEWNVSNVKNTNCMFEFSAFKGDVSKWTPVSLEIANRMFGNCDAVIPYWGKVKDNNKRTTMINNYLLKKELDVTLKPLDNPIKKIKI